MMASTLTDPGLGKVADDTGIDELHQQYLLGFAPPARDGKTHKIDVRFTRSGLKARVRKTYVAPK